LLNIEKRKIMTNSVDSSQLPETRTLANGIIVSYENMSRLIAADRWLVKIKCKVFCPVNLDDLSSLAGDDQELLAELRNVFAEGLSHEILRERNFVDEAEKQEIIEEIIAQYEINVENYMGSDVFTRRLLKTRAGEIVDSFRLRQNMPPEPVMDDDDGPADFSACFRD